MAETCCCDPPNAGIELRRVLACTGNCISSVTNVKITVGPINSPGGGLWPLLCSGTFPTAGHVIYDLWDDGGESSDGGSPISVWAATACTDPLNAELVLYLRCGGLETTQGYVLADGCLGTYTRNGASSIFPATVLVEAA